MSVKNFGPGRYLVRTRIRRPGKVLQRQTVFKGTKEAARALDARNKEEMRTGYSPGSLTAKLTLNTFGDLLKLQLEKLNCSKGHRQKVEWHKEQLGSIPLDFFADRFEGWLKLRRLEGGRKKESLISKATYNRSIQIASTAFNLAVNLGLVDKNPITKYRFPKLKTLPRDIVLTADQRKRLLNAVATTAPHLSAVLRFALAVPCRRSELVNARREDLDLINNCIRVKADFSKNDRGCWKPIPPDLLHYFRTLPPETEYLFYRKVGGNDRHPAVEYRPLGDWKHAWMSCLKEAKLDGLHFHDCRHMSATDLIDNGTPEQAVMTIANWKTNMLRSYYHREPKKVLELVRFAPVSTDCGYFVATPKSVSS